MSSPPGPTLAAAVPQGLGGEPQGTREFLDVPRLLEASRPGGGVSRAMLLLPPLGLVGLLAAIVIMLFSPGRSLWLPLVALGGLATSAVVMIILSRLAAGVRQERQGVAQIEELITLRHFAPAADKLAAVLSRPMRMEHTRRMALVQLARVLMRYHRFDDAIDVAGAVIDDPQTDPGTRFAAGCGRAMAMLRAGRLYDAGEMIGQLRREVNRLDETMRRLAERAADGPGIGVETDADWTPPREGSDGTDTDETQPPREPFDSMALTLVELYRDIQTRHSAEAASTFEQKRAALRDALGVRFGDPLALAALAHQRLGEVDQARRLWSDATCLLPEPELRRRYPELAEVASAQPATPQPGGGTGGGGGGGA